MKTLFLALIATLAIAGTARAQEPKAHEHEHAQPPAVADQKSAGEAEHKDMCMCCMDMKNGDKTMQDKMKAMQDKMQGMKQDKK